MKVILTSVPLLGHLNAVLAIGRMLVDEGHEVVALSASHFRDRIERIGARFVPFPSEIDIDASDMARAYPEFDRLEPGPAMTLFYFQRVFADPLAPQHRALTALLKHFDADLIVADNLCMGILPMLLNDHPRRPAVVACGTTYLMWRRDDRGPCNLGFPPARNDADRCAYGVVADELDEVFTRPFAAHLDACLHAAGAPSLPMDVLDAVTCLPDAHLQLSVPAFEYPRSDLPPQLHFIGALPITPGQAPLPVWADDLHGARKVVLVTQGTLSNADFGALVQPTLAALANAPDLLVVVTTGGRRVESLGSHLPANARVASYLPFEWLLPKVDVLVTNGGYNSVNQALSFGIPIVVAGLTEDKADVAARIAWSGAGIDLRTNRPGVANLLGAVRRVLDDPAYRERAAMLAADFARIDTRAEALRIIGDVVARRHATC
ncbi:hypothetical protein KPL74_07990 [Bacillus sp. NP157]|nr:hypothetical protein KPL74_07990 [Bacillus sp. NP157]